MQAKDLIGKARDEYIMTNKDEQLKAAYLKVGSHNDVEEELTNYVMNKLLEQARKEGGNMFMGDSGDLNEYIFEFYTDYDNLDKSLFDDTWSKYITGIGNSTPKKEKQTPEVNVEAIKKQAIADYKADLKAKEEEAKRKKAEEEKAKIEAKRLAEAQKPKTTQMSLFDF